MQHRVYLYPVGTRSLTQLETISFAQKGPHGQVGAAFAMLDILPHNLLLPSFIIISSCAIPVLPNSYWYGFTRPITIVLLCYSIQYEHWME
jgi:hypothetical protein